MKSKNMLLRLLSSLDNKNGKINISFEGKTYCVSSENAELFRQLRKRLEYDDLILDMSSIQAKYQKARKESDNDWSGHRDVKDAILKEIAEPFMKKHPQYDFEATCSIMKVFNTFYNAFEDVRDIVHE